MNPELLAAELELILEFVQMRPHPRSKKLVYCKPNGGVTGRMEGGENRFGATPEGLAKEMFERFGTEWREEVGFKPDKKAQKEKPPPFVGQVRVQLANM